ncbi:MAG: hypothetical protein V4436_02040 [Patescibacteria group bacterium]
MIEIKTIPHNEQRYDTVGDYWEDAEGAHIRVSAMEDLRYEYLVAIHELVEYFLVKLAGVSIDTIDSFDKNFEDARLSGNEDEPGDDLQSPYFMQHQVATMVERICAFAMGVLWAEYEKACHRLFITTDYEKTDQKV